MPRGENRPSLLLSQDENEMVFSLIGPKCQSLSTAVVQLFTTEGPGHSEWKKKDTGVLCLIKDNGKRSYFFRIYCLYRKAMVWEHEVYIQIEYKCPRPYLHTFEAEIHAETHASGGSIEVLEHPTEILQRLRHYNYIVGKSKMREEYMTAFNFANEDEAKILRNILIEKIEFRKQRREERRRRSELAASANNAAVIQNYNSSHGGHGVARQNGVAAPTPPPPAAPAPLAPKVSLAGTGSYGVKSSSKKPKTRKLTKADIGMPKDFKHISHVGWDANKGFDVDVDNLPEEEMRSFFSKAGISDSQLQDHATRQFIYDFIYTHGGLDAVKEELHDVKPPAAKANSRAPQPPSTPAPAPPVPSRSPAPSQPPGPPSRAPPPPPARAVPPPPPPPASLTAPRNPPPPRPIQPPSSGPPSVPPPPPPPPPPNAAGGAPPPPPPPPLAPPPPPAPLTPAVAADAAPDPRAALMESIRSGNKNLKHVEVASKAPQNEDNRSNLLSEIRQGIELRSVAKETSSAPAEKRAEPCGLAGALARALQERSRAIHSSDSDLSDETTSGGEWDD